MAKQPMITLGTVSSGGIGTQDINIGGAAQSWKRVVSNSQMNAGDSALILMVDDDTPVIIGDGGYSLSG